MLKPGMVISERYEIVNMVGSGGMADVFKAKDLRLNRFVAIKVLKPEFSNDKSFVNKFRGEAQSAAGLSHPNVVNVYDVGDDSGLHYIVMELVEGITLKKFIERKGKLEIKEAVGIAIQIAQGMEAAHSNHIIHRDIKPQNIIISREGKVKVTDFGIAKATTSNTITSNAMGSVHYLSPEQARGGYSDEKSDIYSLGVTLYEMLSGKVPFAGDNTVSVALLHIQGEAMPLRELYSEIPVSLDKIVQKCMQKKPERRYLSASELILDLKRSISNPDGEYVKLAAATQIANDSPTINISEDLAKIKRSAYEDDYEEDSEVTKYSNVVPKEEEEEEDIDPVDARMDKAAMIGNIAMIVILSLVIIFIVFYFLGVTKGKDKKNPVQPTPTPNITEDITNIPTITDTPDITMTPAAEQFVLVSYVGMTKEDAESAIKASAPNVLITFREEFSDLFQEGYVIEQYPGSGNPVKLDGKIILTISLGSQPISLPSVYGLTEDQALKKLEDYGLKAKREYQASDLVEAGKIIVTDPAVDATVVRGSVITIYISTGPADTLVSVPNLIEKTEEEAESLLDGLKLELGTITRESSSTYAAGLITYQSNSEGQKVKEGTKIDVTISTGPEEVTPPPSISDNPDDVPANVKYIAELIISDNPFDLYDESEANILLELVQDGGATTVFEEYLSIMDFPKTFKIYGESESDGVIYMYIDDIPVTLGGTEPASWTVEFRAVEE